MTEPPKDDNVLDVKKWKADGEPFLTLHHGTDRPFCGHRCQVLVDLDARTIECSKCKAILDPYAVLNMIARSEEMMVYTRERKIALEAQIVELRKEEKRIKARLKTARARLKETEGR